VGLPLDSPRFARFARGRCADNSLYVGSCTDLSAREVRHNEGKGAKYTKDRRPIKKISMFVMAVRSSLAPLSSSSMNSLSTVQSSFLAASRHSLN